MNQQLLNAVAEVPPLRWRAGETCVAFDIAKNRAKCNRDIVNCQCMFLIELQRQVSFAGSDKAIGVRLTR